MKIKNIVNVYLIGLALVFTLSACEDKKIDECKNTESSEECNTCCEDEGYSGSSYNNSAESEPCTCLKLELKDQNNKN